MKGGKRTSKGRIINIDDVIAAAPHATAVGNMRINAQGDELGPGGEVTKTREQRARAYYKEHPQASNKKVSLKGDMNTAFDDGHTDFGGMQPDTARTAYENVRTSTEDAEPVAPEPEEFDASLPPEAELDENGDYVDPPTGYREVEQENGDIVMQPYWDDEDTEPDPDNSSKLA
jgi:hypothetical protein